MKTKLKLTAGLAAALIATPALTLAANSDAFALLKTLRGELRDTSLNIANLQSSARHMDSDWRSEAPVLDDLKADVNTMGRTFAKLETARASATPEEQKAIDKAGMLLNKMASDTTAAIGFVSGHRGDIWIPDYQNHVRNLVNETEQLSGIVGEAVHLTEIRFKEKRIETALGM